MNPDLYKLTLDEKEGLVTFFLYNPNGKLVGYQHYRPSATFKKANDPKSARYYTYLPREVDGLFGLEQDSGVGTLYVVEGVFKAAKLHSLGLNSVAVLGATPRRLRSQFRVWKATRNLVAIGDNDPAGAELVKIVGQGFQSPLDLDEMTNEEILCLLTC